MSDRFRILYQLNPDGFCAGAPVLICGGNLLWDAFSCKPCVQLKLQSICSEVIQSVSVHIDLFDNAGELVESSEYSYDNLNAVRNQYFGDQEVIQLNDTSGTAFDVRTVDVVMHDGTVRNPYRESVSYLPEQLPLQTVLNNDAELEKQFQTDYGKVHKYAPFSVDDLWLCSCGAINNSGESFCHSCGIRADVVLNPDIAGLEERKNARLHKETKKRKDTRKTKQLATAGIAVAVAAAMIAAIIYYMIMPAARYKKAERLYSSEDYRAAFELYKKAGSFKDSEQKSAGARQKIWESEYEKVLTDGYLDYFSAQDMLSTDTIFGLAYINDDDIPELIVSPYSYNCCIFTINEDAGYMGSPEVVNTVLTFDSDDYNEIGYYEKSSYVYSKHGSDDGVAFGKEYELWTPFGDDATDDFPEFETRTDRHSIFGNSGVSVDFIITRDGNYSYYNEDEFYNELYSHVDADAYKAFELWRNTFDNRCKVLHIQPASCTLDA